MVLSLENDIVRYIFFHLFCLFILRLCAYWLLSFDTNHVFRFGRMTDLDSIGREFSVNFFKERKSDCKSVPKWTKMDRLIIIEGFKINNNFLLYA